MTPDWRATEDGKRAVEAFVDDVTVPDDTEDRMLWRGRAVHVLRCALPHLDRMFRERYAAALEAEAEKRFPKRRFEETDCYHAREWDLAASFLRREPTL